MKSILQGFKAARADYDTAIIAGCGDDIISSECIEWIEPVLDGAQARKWVTCRLEIEDEGLARVHLRTSQMQEEVEITSHWSANEVAGLRSIFPAALGLAIVLVAQHTSQVFHLLDGVADWLDILEIGRAELQPLVRILASYGIVAPEVATAA